MENKTSNKPTIQTIVNTGHTLKRVNIDYKCQFIKHIVYTASLRKHRHRYKRNCLILQTVMAGNELFAVKRKRKERFFV